MDTGLTFSYLLGWSVSIYEWATSAIGRVTLIVVQTYSAQNNYYFRYLHIKNRIIHKTFEEYAKHKKVSEIGMRKESSLFHRITKVIQFF